MRSLLFILFVSLTGCASTGNNAKLGQNPQQLAEMINRVAQQQKVDLTDDISPYLLVAEFNLQTDTLLANPSLMPALEQVKTDDLIISIAVAPGNEQLALLSHGIKLTAQLQAFLQAQRFGVQRRFDANSSVTQIRIEPLLP